MAGTEAAAAHAAAGDSQVRGGQGQPCKKRKEDDSSIKAITKYFSPLGKNVHRVASPPKPNNIMGYFKKTSPTNEKIVSPVTEKESKTTSLSLENSSKPSSGLKRRGKKCNLTNTLKDVKTFDLVIEINGDDSREILSSEEKDSKTSSISPIVPGLLGPTNAEEMLNGCNQNPLKIVSFKNQDGKIRMEGDIIKTNAKRSKKRKHKDESDLSESFVTERQQKDLYKAIDDKQVASISECENKSLVNIQNYDTTAHETPHLNHNIVTVSFEDFLKSQAENKVDHITKAETSDNSIACDETDRCQDVQQLPLKKVTVLAQIHSVPPKSSSSQKIASIFLKRKTKEAKRQSSPSASEGESTEQMTLKRKSNVVIAEEELELAVLETSGPEVVKSKCTAEERYQFMKAFKQPESETVKTGAKKGPGKQKEVEGKSSKHKLEMEVCEDVSNKKLENEVSAVSFHEKDSKNDSSRVRTNKLKRKKKILKTKEKVLTMNTNQKSEVNDQIKAGTSTEAQSKLPEKNNGLRRSPRQMKSKDSVERTPEKAEIVEAVTKNTLPAIPLQASTPKTNNKMFSKSDLYKAEMITEPFDSKSPIRMKFTRISITERFMQQSIKVNTTSNNISKAKKLVEKAKVLQHHRKTRTAGTLHVPLRRSSRQQAIADRRRSQNVEDSVITLDSCTSIITTVVGSVDKQKKRQNLNDVLGKKARNTKATKKSNGKEKLSVLVWKNIKKPTDEAITILDESSEDGSENSQDDEQFRAKREFLMSGLPESLKRQIAKKAAALEAYSLANSCFQTVVHVQQKDDGCLMWSLPLPSCPLLTNLRKVDLDVTDVTKLTFSLGEFSVLNTHPCNTDSPIAMLSGRRPAFSDAQKNCLLEEIQFFNTHFPVKQFFDLIMKKQAAPENNKQVNKYEALNSETSRKTDNRRKAKRKRKTEDHKSKRRKPVGKTENDLPAKVSKVSNVKQAGLENTAHLLDTHEIEEAEILTIDDSEFGSETSPASDFTHEDILWTEKYQPQNSSELIGNTVAIRKLHRWLCEWKRRADWEENRTQKEESDTQEEFSDSVDFQDDKSDSEDETVLCNTMLLIGPPGIGKTAAVYACAQELGFKIFEVNASCQRSGRQILSHLKEATQSHQVAKQGVHAHKPSFFNSDSTSKSPKKNSPRNEWSPRKLPVSPREVGLKQSLAPKTLANYFKISSKLQSKGEAQKNNKENKEILAGENTQIKSVKREIKEEESSKKCATSLILFEEVDIIFDEDVGFLNAIKTFMTTTKRPVILTTNDPSFSLIFDGCFEEITFSAPSLINVASYLQVLCLAENLRTDIKDFAALLTSNNCDIRQSILHLQFWVKSGGGCLKEKGMALHGPEKKASGSEQGACIKEPTTKTRNPDPLVKIPKCDTGCIENLLGLTNIFVPSEDLFSFLKHEITTKEEWNKLIHLLTEFQRKHIDFIYSNLENILPLPVNILPEPMHVPNLLHKNFIKSSSNNGPVDSDCLGKDNPVKKDKQTKHRRKIAVLDDSDLFESELNCSGFVTVPSDTTSPCLEENPEYNSTVALNDETTAKTKGCALTFQCLNSITEFVDNMSLLDCCFSWRTQESTQSCKYEEFIWTKGKIKNGLSDEFSVEDTDWWTSQSSIELKATMEALNFNKCFKSISKIIMENALNTARTPGKNEFEDGPLHMSKDQPNLYFGHPAANSRIHHNAQKRLELIETVFSGRTLNFCNRQASVMEYLPTLRNICKSEKQKERGKTKRRFLHYLEGIHLPKETLNSLATDFP